VRVPLVKPSDKPQKAKEVKQWACCKFKKLRRLAIPLIFIAIIRHLPFMLCLAGMWAGFQIMKKKRALLRVCAECTHNEGCRVGKKCNRIKKGMNNCGIVPKILFVMACFLVRVLPMCALLILAPLIMCACRKLRRVKKGMCQNWRANVESMCGRYRDILTLSWPQLAERVQQSQAPRGGVPSSVVGCAAVAASESLAASVATIVALSESVAAELGVNIPVAVPVGQLPYPQQTRILKEMGFEDSPVLQQLLAKHSGNLQAVVSEFMQLKKQA
jgi:hypothetical protein